MKKLLSLVLICTLMLTLSMGIALASDEEAAEVVEWLLATMTEGYMGVMDEGTTAFFAFGEVEGGIFAMLVFLDASHTQSASFVGFAIDNEDGTFTVEDENSGYAIVIGLEAVEGGFLLDLGEYGSGAIAPVNVTEVIEAFVIIHYGAEAVA